MKDPRQHDTGAVSKPAIRELEDAVQEAALTAWRIDQERKRAARLARWRRWAARK